MWQRLRNFGRTSLYGLVYSISVGFLFVNTLVSWTDKTSITNRVLSVVAITLIMVCPLWVDRMYRAGRMRHSFRWLMVMAYLFTVLVLGFSAIGWYLVPDNSRWEPLTIILGFTTSWLTLLQNGWREEDRILSVFNFGPDDV